MQQITQQTLKDTMYYGAIPVLSYQIHYPSFTTSCNAEAAQKINKYYCRTAKSVEQYCRTMLYSQALESARYTPTNHPPFNSYTLDITYQVTYNSGCIASLYIDSYAYLGGAHGETRRISDTWNFNSGIHLKLSDFDLFAPASVSLFKIKKSIERQIEKRIAENPGSYFEDYKTLLQNSFNQDSYYLLPGGYMIYFQQYDIAPYATGIPEFFYSPVPDNMHHILR